MHDIEAVISREISLFTELGAHPIRRSNTILIPRHEVRGLVGRLLLRNIRLIGLKGFVIHSDNTVQLSLDALAECSNGQPSKEFIDYFLSDVPEAITHFEIVVEA